VEQARRPYRPHVRPTPAAASRFAACKQALLDNVQVTAEQSAAIEHAARVAPYRKRQGELALESSLA
jgi:hypothetical protein